MGSNIQSNLGSGVGLFGSGPLTVYLTGSSGLASQPAFIPRRLVVYSTKDQLKNSLLGNWLGGEKATFWEMFSRTADWYDEIVVLPFDPEHMKHLQLTKEQEKEVFRFMLEDLPTRVKPGGRIVNLNDLSEEQNEPQRPSGQADAGEPDAS